MDYQYLICEDCFYWYEHGSIAGLTIQRCQEVTKYASGHFTYVAPDGDEDGFVAFSREPCDACETHLSGMRFPAVIMEVKK